MTWTELKDEAWSKSAVKKGGSIPILPQ